MAGSLKIIFYVHALAGGGAERVWSVLASSLAARGHDIVFAVDYEASENRSVLDRRVRLVVLGGSHAHAIGALRRLIRAERPDVVAGALAASNLKLAIAAALAGWLPRTVLTCHGYAESEPQRLSQIGFWAMPLLTRLAARTVAVSEGLLQYIRTRWHASAARTLRIYNPVHVGAPAVAAPTDGGPVVLAAGRFVPYKNFAGLLRAFAASSSSESHLLLLGDGPERGKLEGEVARLGLASRVFMPGYVAEPWRYYAKAHCFVLPSHSEAFGLVLVEAMAHGLEIVATDCHGPREILENGRHGRLVPPGDEAALAAAIDAALAQRTDPTARMARARHFDVGTAADRYEELFRTVAAEAAARKSGSLWRGGGGRVPAQGDV